MSDITQRLLDLAVQIQQIPSPTFGEGERAAFVRRQFEATGLREVSLDVLHNVYARLPGSNASRPLIVSAHLDTVFPEDTALSISRDSDRVLGPGIGDNALGVAALLGLAWMLQEGEGQAAGDLWLVANVCEEGLGDLRGMKSVVDRFGANVRGYLVLEGTALGQVYHRAVGVRRYRVTVRTAGGHAWSDYGQPSAIHELTRLAAQITSLPLPAKPRTTLNVGLISGGTGVNVLASRAELQLDLRSEGREALTLLISEVEGRILSARRNGVDLDFQIIGERPAGELPLDHPFVRLADECIAEQGLQAAFTAGSTDANIPLSRGIPAVVLGITTGGGAHTINEYIDVAPVRQGMQQLHHFVGRALAQL